MTANFRSRGLGAAPPTLTPAVPELGSGTDDDQVTITVVGTGTNPMLDRDSFTVTYHKVMVEALDFFELEDGMASDMFSIDDSIDGASYEMESTVTVMPPMPSTVSVGPPSVDQGDITDVAVTYVVQEDMLFGDNNVHIGLPRGLGVPLIERVQ